MGKIVFFFTQKNHEKNIHYRGSVKEFLFVATMFQEQPWFSRPTMLFSCWLLWYVNAIILVTRHPIFEQTIFEPFYTAALIHESERNSAASWACRVLPLRKLRLF